jgi:hypothetical protein
MENTFQSKQERAEAKKKEQERVREVRQWRKERMIQLAQEKAKRTKDRLSKYRNQVNGDVSDQNTPSVSVFCSSPLPSRSPFAAHVWDLCEKNGMTVNDFCDSVITGEEDEFDFLENGEQLDF